MPARPDIFLPAAPLTRRGCFGTLLARTLLAGTLAAAVLPVAAADVAAGDSGGDPRQIEFFEKRVRPLLAANCFNCHSADNKAAGELRVDDRNGLLAGGKRGPAVVPGEPGRSLILRAVRHDDGVPRMPPEGRLEPEEIAALEAWIAAGAAWPAVEPSDSQGGWTADHDALRRSHWAFQPLTATLPPAVTDPSWPRDEVDHHVLAGLSASGLTPVGDSPRDLLLRRLHADLTGLPPTAAEIDVFRADTSADAVDRVVDALLASPAFGERWGRHWLDVARYGESTGSARNVPYPHAWRYRDWVIDAVNADMPFDRFIIEQIAGDLLPAADEAARERQLVATGFLAIGVKDVNQRFKVRFVMDNIDEQIDAIGRGILGLTVSCARCHDHKTDPVPATDYYALAGILHSTEQCAGVRNKMGGGGYDYYDSAALIVLSPPVADDERLVAARAAAEAAREEFERIRGTPEGLAKGTNGRPVQQAFRQRWNKAQQELQQLADPARTGRLALGVRDAAAVGDIPLRIRGEAEQHGPVVPRGFLTAVEVPGAEPVDPAGSGRLQLARWLAHPANPLTARVHVNRVWQRLFGRGLVDTVDNFGLTGNPPSHPALLDRLAADFIADGWSTKRLVRRLVRTRTYGLAATAAPEAIAVDPDNRLLWRNAPRRLDAEEIRDRMLAVAGRLDHGRPDGGPSRSLEVREIRNDGPEAAALLAFAQADTHRSVYLPLVRTIVPGPLAAFDFADQGQVTGSRDVTTVPAQALYLLNSAFVGRQALAAAEAILARPAVDDRLRIAEAFRAVLTRAPAPAELDAVAAFLADFQREAPAGQTVAEVAAATTDVATASSLDPAIDPDQAQPAAVRVAEELPRPRDARTAAWAAFVQALMASAEFRYVQ